MDHDALYRHVDPIFTGHDIVDAGFANGNGVILAVSHSGNFDVAGVWAARRHGGFTTIAERLRPESLYRKFVAYRESLGFEVLPLTGGDRHPLVVLSQRLRANRMVCLVSDRDLTSAGVPVTFFGETASMPAGPAMLAARTGAALLPVSTWYTKDGWRCDIQPPIPVAGKADVHAATQRLADMFAVNIAAHPADWHMTQKLWLADLAAEPDGAPDRAAV
jgi:KDO2-lipid IV(A) lauroyltransferase